MKFNLHGAVSPRSVVVALLAGVLGFLSNDFPLTILGEQAIFFGGLFVLLVSVLQGPGFGAVASLVAFGGVGVETGEWMALLCFTAEAVWVGRLVRRGRTTVAADMLFWSVLGLPALALFYLTLSKTPFPNNWILPAKYPANGLLLALVTHLLVQSTWCLKLLGARSKASSEGPLKQVIFSRFVILAALPITLLAILGGHQFDKILTREAERHIEERAQWISIQIESFLREHQRAIQTTATDLFALGEPEEGELYEDLQALKETHPEILTLIVANSKGTIVGAYPIKDADGNPIVDGTRSVADREYFREPKKTGRPFISDVFEGRGFGRELIVAISVPYWIPSGELYVLEASMNLGALRDEVTRDLEGKDLQALIVDHKEHVVTASDELGAKPLDDARGLNLYTASTTSPPTFRHNQPRPGKTGEEIFLASRNSVSPINWTVIVQEPLWKTQRTIVGFYVMTLIGAALAILLVSLLARDTQRTSRSPWPRSRPRRENSRSTRSCLATPWTSPALRSRSAISARNFAPRRSPWPAPTATWSS